MRSFLIRLIKSKYVFLNQDVITDPCSFWNRDPRTKWQRLMLKTGQVCFAGETGMLLFD